MYAKLVKLCLLGMVVFMSTSCSNDSDDPGPNATGSYFIRFNANGVKKEYKLLTYASFSYDEDYPIYEGVALAGLTSDGSKDVMSFFLTDKKEFQTGKTYNVKNPGDTSGPHAMMTQLKVVYLDENGTPFTAIFPDIELYKDLNVKDEAQLIFTEISDAHIKGTFSATVFTEFPERKKLIITDGEFMLQRID
jgi:hypothetical protein